MPRYGGRKLWLTEFAVAKEHDEVSYMWWKGRLRTWVRFEMSKLFCLVVFVCLLCEWQELMGWVKKSKKLVPDQYLFPIFFLQFIKISFKTYQICHITPGKNCKVLSSSSISNISLQFVKISIETFLIRHIPPGENHPVHPSTDSNAGGSRLYLALLMVLHKILPGRSSNI